ncbi:hypothetical protein Pcinc_018085 [Petrolisthes cinctipes]|uniref:Uncharacterized protein n=1 Tax=Petrolisthes cinctipes TaxID=88211 RepID=A0AAE1FMV6_PETCI|nr:hypothetical protein Pcinc_018085 [Petrolisthes cinctipes]
MFVPFPFLSFHQEFRPNNLRSRLLNFLSTHSPSPPNHSFTLTTQPFIHPHHPTIHSPLPPNHSFTLTTQPFIHPHHPTIHSPSPPNHSFTLTPPNHSFTLTTQPFIHPHHPTIHSPSPFPLTALTVTPQNC